MFQKEKRTKNVQKLFANVNKQPAQRAWSSLPTRLASARHQPTQRDHGYGLVYHAMCMFTLAAFAGYSYRLSTEGWLRLSRPGRLGWAHGSAPRWFTHPKTVTHPGTNRAWRRVTTLIENNVLPLSQNGNYLIGIRRLVRKQ